MNSSTPQVHFSRPYGTEIDLSTTRVLAGERLGMTTVLCLRNCIAPGKDKAFTNGMAIAQQCPFVISRHFTSMPCSDMVQPIGFAPR
jgi:hypothetical protein